MRMYEGTPEEIAALHGLQNAEWQAQLSTSLNSLHEKVNHMATEQEDMAQDMTAAVEILKKVETESKSTLDKATAFEAALADAGTKVTPALKAAWTALKAQIKVTDDVITDAPTDTSTQNPSTVNPA